MMLNIPKTVTDCYYRYQRPEMKIFHSGRGYSLKTELRNLNKIAKSLNRNSKMICKYLAIRKGLRMSIIDSKYYLNGFHNINELETELECFIQKSVLCKRCHNPETDLEWNKNNVYQLCRACGHLGVCSDSIVKASYRKSGIKANCQNNNKNKSKSTLKAIINQSNSDIKNISFESSTTDEDLIYRRLELLGIEQSQKDLVEIMLNSNNIPLIKSVPLNLSLNYYLKYITKENIKQIAQILLELNLESNKKQLKILSYLKQNYLKYKDDISASNIVYYFYDVDLLDEDIIIDWYKILLKKDQNDAICEELKKLIEWLLE